MRILSGGSYSVLADGERRSNRFDLSLMRSGQDVQGISPGVEVSPRLIIHSMALH